MKISQHNEKLVAEEKQTSIQNVKYQTSMVINTLYVIV